MGFLDFITGKDKSSTNERSEGTGLETTVDRTTLSGTEQGISSQQTGAVSGTEQTTQQEQVQTSLDAETQAQIKSLISILTGQVGEEGISGLSPNVQAGAGENLDFARLFADRAAGADGAFAGNIEDIIGSARLQGQRALDQSNTGITRAAGSGLNTAVQALKNRGSNDLEVQLAALAGELGFDARRLGTEEFSAAGQAFGSAVSGAAQTEIAGRGSVVGDITSLADILKGAETTQVGTIGQVGRTETQETINQFTESLRLLEEMGISITESEFDKSGSGITKGGGDSLLDWLGAMNN